jgi:hypothetical protein
MEFGSFPKALAYNVKALEGFSKTPAVRLTPDKWDNIKANDTIKVALPQNTLVDLRTFCMYFEGIGDTNLHFPRNTSSLIKTLSVYINGNLVERIDNYSVLYNRLYDLEAGNDQVSKRFLENADPSVYYETGIASTSVATGVYKLTSGQGAVKRKYAITSWLGFLSTLSTPIIDTNDLNKVEIEITFESGSVMFQKQQLTPVTGGYTLSDVHFTINKIVFNSSLYYNLKASKLLSSGLTIGYQTYICSKGALANKSSSYNVYTSFNTTSLDQLIGCFTPEDQTTSNLLLNGHWTSAGTGALPFQNVISLASHTDDTAGGVTGAGGYFNQSRFFRSDACGLTSSSWEINNTPIIPIPLADYEVYNESLIALGHNHIDMGIGVHPGLQSLAHFLKFYFTAICSLEMINAGDFYKSGLDGKSSALNVVWKLAFGANTTDKITPYIFAKTTRILQINEGHSVSVIV